MAAASQQRRLQVLRGPIILATAASFVCIPYILLHFSFYWIVFGLFELALVVGGCWLLVIDVKTILCETYQPRIEALVKIATNSARQVDSLVLDDIFRFVFDPEGLIACAVGSCVGTSLAYGLPGITTEHRLQICQSAFGVSLEQAEAMLLQPGGYVYLFPASMQDWWRRQLWNQRILDNTPPTQDKSTDGIGKEEDGDAPELKLCARTDDSSTAVSSEADLNDTEPVLGMRIRLPPTLLAAIDRSGRTSAYQSTTLRTRKRRLPVHEPPHQSQASTRSLDAASCDDDKRTVPCPIQSLTSPTTLLYNILLDQLKVKIRSLFLAMPQEKMIHLGALAGAALLAQLIVSKRARRITVQTLSTSLTMGAASALAGSLAFLTARQTMSGESIVSGRHVLILSRAWRACKEAVRGTPAKWKGVLALFVLVYFAKRRRMVSGSGQLHSVHQSS